MSEEPEAVLPVRMPLTQGRSREGVCREVVNLDIKKVQLS